MNPSVAIVGAGFGGLAAAIELKRAGIDSFTVFERADEVGGVWQANTYPGAACDVPSVIYQFSYALKGSTGAGDSAAVTRSADYLRQTSAEFGLREHIRFGTEVEAATFDEDNGRWTLELAGGETAEFDVLICATGQLSRPRMPDVAGRGTFTGAQFHSAEWDHSVDLDGKRVVVVGGGASAIQVVPAIAGARRAPDRRAALAVVGRQQVGLAPDVDRAPAVGCSACTTTRCGSGSSRATRSCCASCVR